MPEHKIKIASVPDRENLVAELWKDAEMWGELSAEIPGRLVLEVYPRVSGEPWCFDFDDVVRMLKEARSRLLELPTETDSVS